MAGEVTELFRVWKARRNLQVDRSFFDCYERDGLVSGAFHKKLDLRVLVGRAQRRQGSRSHRRSIFAFLAEALRPQLNEPCGEIAEWIRVRHEDGNRLL